MKAPASLRIVIADDEPLILHLVGQEVNIAGHKVVGQALDGREALELTERLKPDVVLMDISMPEMDGFEATELIQDRCPTPVVMLTAHLEQEMLERAADCGVGAYLAKPPQAGDINRAIVVAMARHALLELKVLHGLLPICCSCKKIHDESGKWEQLESYISAHTDAKFTHTYCPSCARQYFPGMVDENGLVREHRLPTAR
ncbi:MAG: response regulator [Opitutaceae bacterium]|nr:response regulator [Opitutaceae bacterium]